MSSSSIIDEDQNLFKGSDDDDTFTDYLKEYSIPFKNRWYASITSTTGMNDVEQDDSDDAADVAEPTNQDSQSNDSEIGTSMERTIEDSISEQTGRNRYYYIRRYSSKPVQYEQNSDEYLKEAVENNTENDCLIEKVDKVAVVATEEMQTSGPEHEVKSIEADIKSVVHETCEVEDSLNKFNSSEVCLVQNVIEHSNESEVKEPTAQQNMQTVSKSTEFFSDEIDFTNLTAQSIDNIGTPNKIPEVVKPNVSHLLSANLTLSVSEEKRG